MKKYINSAIAPIYSEPTDIKLDIALDPNSFATDLTALANDPDDMVRIAIAFNPNTPQEVKDSMNYAKYVFMEVDVSEHYGYFNDSDWGDRVCDNPTENIVIVGMVGYESAYWYQDAIAILNDFENSRFSNQAEFVQAYSIKYDTSIINAIWEFMNTNSEAFNYNHLVIRIIRFIYPELHIAWGNLTSFNNTVIAFYNSDVVDLDILTDFFTGDVCDVYCCEITPDCLGYIRDNSFFWMLDNGIIDGPCELMSNSEYEHMSIKDLANLFNVDANRCIAY